jgi:D-aminoacyl-tRNA deacylase
VIVTAGPDVTRRRAPLAFGIMRVLLQRVSRAEVRVHHQESGQRSVAGPIGTGYVLLVGFAPDDREADVDWMSEKVLGLRLFPDDEGKMNRSLDDVGGALFTLYGDARKGRRPSFIGAARPEHAIPLYERFVALLRASGATVETGEFGAHMEVELINDGPVTLWLERESDKSGE